MIRGTTAPFTFKLPYSKNDIEWAIMKFWQDGNTFTPITKRETDCTSSDEYEYNVLLTPAETLKFSDKMKAKAQLVAKLKSGVKFGSHQQLVTVYPILNDDDLIGDNPTEDAPVEDGWAILDGGVIVSQGGDD